MEATVEWGQLPVESGLNRASVILRANDIAQIALVKATADAIEARFVEIKEKHPETTEKDALDQAVEFVAASLRSGLVDCIYNGRKWRRLKND